MATDVTNDWADGDKARKGANTESRPAVPGPGAMGASTAGPGASTVEPKSFAGGEAGAQAPAAGGASDEETLLRATLETIRTKAEDLRVQTRGWSQIRSEQARQLIDERPVTAVAAAFGVGLVLGALLSR